MYASARAASVVENQGVPPAASLFTSPTGQSPMHLTLRTFTGKRNAAYHILEGAVTIQELGAILTNLG